MYERKWKNKINALIEYKISKVGTIDIYFEPYLKDVFKDAFRTAKWRTNFQCWEIKNTKANLNKLNKFLDSVKLREAVEFWEAYENQEFAPSFEIAMHEAILNARRVSYSAAMTASEILTKAGPRLDSIKTKLDAITKGVADKAKKVATASAEMRPTFDAILAPYELDGQTVVEVLIEVSQLVGKVKAARPTPDTAIDVQQVVRKMAWLRDVHGQIAESHKVNFTYLLAPLTAAHVFYRTVHSPEQARDWLYNTALMWLPTTDREEIRLDKLGLDAHIKEVKPARGKFKI